MKGLRYLADECTHYGQHVWHINDVGILDVIFVNNVHFCVVVR